MVFSYSNIGHHADRSDYEVKSLYHARYAAAGLRRGKCMIWVKRAMETSGEQVCGSNFVNVAFHGMAI
jgi:hypothetical protein